MDKCMREIEELMDQNCDRVAVYLLGASCDGKRIYAGAAGYKPRIGEEDVFIV